MRMTLSEITKRYGRTMALDRVSIEFPEGAIVAIVGVNGAGKTTLLSTMATLTAPDDGRIDCDGDLLSRRRLDLRRRMFFLPDMPVFSPIATVLEHIGMLVSVYEVARPSLEEEVVKLLEEFHLLPQCDARLQTLSRGQRYKAALVGMLTVRPEVLLIDEPFASGIDPPAIAAFRRHMRSHARAGGTVVYSTQIVDLAARLSDLICVLENGAVVACQPFDDLTNNASASIRDLVAALSDDR